jgi:rSAM/selenodomain-associated transferase 1
MANGRNETVAIGVMAKAPVAGRSKTRLCPPLLPEQAAALSAAFLRDTTESMAAAARLAPIVAYAAYAPLGSEALLGKHLAHGTTLLLADDSPPMSPGVQGFGRCLQHAVQGMLARGHAAACVLSGDSPTLPTRLLVQAAEVLLTPGESAVLGPAADGGYYLLGLKAAHPAMFADIAWSTASVAHETRDRARSLGLPLVELERWYDVDSVSSLRLLLAETSGYAAPETNRAVDRLGLRQALTGTTFLGAAE